MRVECSWNEGMKFTAHAGVHSLPMDAKRPIGRESAMNPKELVMAGLAGCTAMDVVALLRKHKQSLESLNVVVDATMTEGEHPVTYRSFQLSFDVNGTVDADILRQAVHLSQTKYCGVSALVVKAAPITYRIVLNGDEVGSGEAKF